MLDGPWRASVDRRTAPIGERLRRSGVSANQLTALGLAVAAGAAFAIGTGHLLVGLVLVIASSLPDLFDGPVAKAAGTSSPRGAFLDSVADRVSDSLVLGGVAWYLATSGHPRQAMLALAVLMAASVVSYERAKAESLGFVARGGVMERAERIIVLGIGLAFPVTLLGVLWAMLALSLVTAAQRFTSVWRQAATPPGHTAAGVGRDRLVATADPPAEQRWRPGRVDSRWRSWREMAVLRAERPRRASAPRRTRASASRWRTRRQTTAGSPGRRSDQRHTRAGTDGSAGRRRLSEALRRRVDGTS